MAARLRLKPRAVMVAFAALPGIMSWLVVKTDSSGRSGRVEDPY
jgi:hypothetical protein